MYTENQLLNKIKGIKKSISFWIVLVVFIVFGIFPWIVGWARIISWFVK
jgi:hypothetical protein